MTETAGSCGIASQARIVSRQPDVMDSLRKGFESRRLAKQELRKAELKEKGENGGLNTTEAMELAGYKIQEGLEKIARLNANSICYLA